MAKKKINCDDGWVLLNRNLDGDLSREEVQHLHRHIAQCDTCRKLMGDLTALDANLLELYEECESKVLDANFNKELMEKLSHIEMENTLKSPKDEEFKEELKEEGFSKIKGELIVMDHVILVMGASSIPLPVWDMVAIAGLQVRLLRRLSDFYGVEFSENLGKSIIAAMIGGIGPVETAKGFAWGLLKFIPGVGQLVGSAALPITAGMVTYAIGNVFIQHFESGGTFLSFDPNKVREHYARELAKGKKMAMGLCEA